MAPRVAFACLSPVILLALWRGHWSLVPLETSIRKGVEGDAADMDMDGSGDLKIFLQSRPLSGPKAAQRSSELPHEVGW